MNIGIIGSGEMGSCLASSLVNLGHTVSIANSRGPESLKQFAGDNGAGPVPVEEVIKNKQIIIVSIPQKNIPQLPTLLFKDIHPKTVVIDTGNYYPNLRDGAIPALDHTGIDSLWVQEQFGFPVVKVFNSILATSLKDLGRPKNDPTRIALAVSGDNKKAKEIVFKLLDQLGFDHFDLGNISQSWRQQPGSPIYCRDINLEELKTRLQTLVSDESAHKTIIAKRQADEKLMKTDYTAYLKTLI